MGKIDHVAECYANYIARLNRRDWAGLRHCVSQDVSYNNQMIGLAGYRDMLIANCKEIPDLKFNVGIVVVEGMMVASQLIFDCTPVGRFLGIPVDGRSISFTENVFYKYNDDKIEFVWSVVDKAAIEAQLKRF